MIARILVAALAAASLVSSIALAKPADVTIQMKEQNKSGETGTAVLSQTPDGVQVVIDMKNAPKDAQPTHIHAGTCDKLTPAPAYPLTNIVDGKSTTVLKNVTLDDLQKTPYAVNVHKSATDLATYVSCGEITTSKSK